MLSKIVPHPRAEEREHLIIELKRPNKKIDYKAAQQILKYANAVANDERFKDTQTQWVFWALSNDITDDVRSMTRQKNRPDGIFHEGTEKRIIIWIKSWSQVLEECRARLEFFKKQLEYTADQDSALAYLYEIHNKYLPDGLK
jgi:hypothetical protein